MPSISVPSLSNLPSIPGGFNACSAGATAQSAATEYVGMAELGYADYAQSCVYKDTVPKATTASIKGSGSTLYAPTGSSGNTFEFSSIDGSSHLRVTVSKEPDGHYYVTKVVKS